MEDSGVNHTTDIWNSSVTSLQHTVYSNASHGCEVAIFSQMEFLPWDNPDNIVSAEVEEISRRIKSFLLLVLFLIGGPGNIINMAVFYKQGLKDRVNLCLFALAFADEVCLIMSMLHHVEQVHLQFTTKDTFGPMITFFTNNHFTGLLGTSYVSQVLSSIIASERCLCILYPLKFQAMMHTRTMACIVMFVYALVLSFYYVVAFRFSIGCVYDPKSGAIIKTAVIGEFYKNHKQLIDNLDGFLFGVSLPVTVAIVVITTTIITVVKLRQIVTWRAGTTSSLSPREVALTKMLVGNSILFLACTVPVSVLRFSWLFLPEMNSGRRHHNFFLTIVWVSETLTYINASFNIMVYYAMGSRYRETCKALLGIRRQVVKQ